jgi:hypothetical protein
MKRVGRHRRPRFAQRKRAAQCTARCHHRTVCAGQLSGTSWISTRRFWARPASVALSATGRVSPKPVTTMRWPLTPRPVR